jgi:hypothetical protein
MSRNGSVGMAAGLVFDSKQGHEMILFTAPRSGSMDHTSYLRDTCICFPGGKAAAS